jgi:hypothetical protein
VSLNELGGMVLYPLSYEGMKGAHPEYRRAMPTLAVIGLTSRHPAATVMLPELVWTTMLLSAAGSWVNPTTSSSPEEESRSIA